VRRCEEQGQRLRIVRPRPLGLAHLLQQDGEVVVHPRSRSVAGRVPDGNGAPLDRIVEALHVSAEEV